MEWNEITSSVASWCGFEELGRWVTINRISRQIWEGNWYQFWWIIRVHHHPVTTCRLFDQIQCWLPSHVKKSMRIEEEGRREMDWLLHQGLFSMNEILITSLELQATQLFRYFWDKYWATRVALITCSESTLGGIFFYQWWGDYDFVQRFRRLDAKGLSVIPPLPRGNFLNVSISRFFERKAHLDALKWMLPFWLEDQASSHHEVEGTLIYSLSIAVMGGRVDALAWVFEESGLFSEEMKGRLVSDTVQNFARDLSFSPRQCHWDFVTRILDALDENSANPFLLPTTYPLIMRLHFLRIILSGFETPQKPLPSDQEMSRFFNQHILPLFLQIEKDEDPLVKELDELLRGWRKCHFMDIFPSLSIAFPELHAGLAVLVADDRWCDFSTNEDIHLNETLTLSAFYEEGVRFQYLIPHNVRIGGLLDYLHALEVNPIFLEEAKIMQTHTLKKIYKFHLRHSPDHLVESEIRPLWQWSARFMDQLTNLPWSLTLSDQQMIEQFWCLSLLHPLSTRWHVERSWQPRVQQVLDEYRLRLHGPLDADRKCAMCSHLGNFPWASRKAQSLSWLIHHPSSQIRAMTHCLVALNRALTKIEQSDLLCVLCQMTANTLKENLSLKQVLKTNPQISSSQLVDLHEELGTHLRHNILFRMDNGSLTVWAHLNALLRHPSWGFGGKTPTSLQFSADAFTNCDVLQWEFITSHLSDSAKTCSSGWLLDKNWQTKWPHYQRQNGHVVTHRLCRFLINQGGFRDLDQITRTLNTNTYSLEANFISFMIPSLEEERHYLSLPQSLPPLDV